MTDAEGMHRLWLRNVAVHPILNAISVAFDDPRRAADIAGHLPNYAV
jgi:hypothetical protein